MAVEEVRAGAVAVAGHGHGLPGELLPVGRQGLDRLIAILEVVFIEASDLPGAFERQHGARGGVLGCDLEGVRRGGLVGRLRRQSSSGLKRLLGRNVPLLRQKQSRPARMRSGCFLPGGTRRAKWISRVWLPAARGRRRT